MSYICWLINAKTLSPLVIPFFRGKQSLQHTLEYIPGMTFRGGFAYSMAEAANQKNIDREKIFCHFQDNGIRITSLLPALDDGLYGIPIPLSARRCKFDHRHPYVDLLTADNDKKSECRIGLQAGNSCGGSLESVEQAFMSAEKPHFIPFSPRTFATMHNEIDDQTGIPVKEILFSIEKIQAGAFFVGGICFKSCEQEAFFWDIVSDKEGTETEWIIGLGQGPSRGRGLVQISAIRHNTWSEVIGQLNGGDLNSRILAANGVKNEKDLANHTEIRLPVTLLSDAVLLNPDLTYQTGLSVRDLKEKLGLNGLNIKLVDAYTEQTILGGWNKKHGRRKIQETAVSMGSTFLFLIETNGGITDPKTFISSLEKLEEEGIGIRRREGYGRVILAHPFHLNPIKYAKEHKPLRVRKMAMVSTAQVFGMLGHTTQMTAEDLVFEEFSDHENQNAVLNLRGDMERWLAYAARQGAGESLNDLITRLGQNIMLQNVYANTDNDWTLQTISLQEWLGQHLSPEWGKFIIDQACVFLNKDLKKWFRPVKLNIVYHSSGGQSLEIKVGNHVDSISLETQWLWDAVRHYFDRLRLDARIF